MAGSISDYLEDKALDHAFLGTAYTPPGAFYLALLLADPLDDASAFSEPSGKRLRSQGDRRFLGSGKPGNRQFCPSPIRDGNGPLGLVDALGNHGRFNVWEYARAWSVD